MSRRAAPSPGTTRTASPWAPRALPGPQDHADPLAADERRGRLRSIITPPGRAEGVADRPLQRPARPPRPGPPERQHGAPPARRPPRYGVRRPGLAGPSTVSEAVTNVPPSGARGVTADGSWNRRRVAGRATRWQPVRALPATILVDGVTSRDERAGRDALLPPSRPRDAPLCSNCERPICTSCMTQAAVGRAAAPSAPAGRARGGADAGGRGCGWRGRGATSRSPRRCSSVVNVLVFLVEMAQGVTVRGHRRRPGRAGRRASTPPRSPTASGTGWSPPASCTRG